MLMIKAAAPADIDSSTNESAPFWGVDALRVNIHELACQRASLIMLILAAFLLAGSYGFGWNKGMQDVLPAPLTTRAQQIASAVSDTAYHLGLRHAAHGAVYAELTRGGMTEGSPTVPPFGFSNPDYKEGQLEWHPRDSEHWNELLAHASQLQTIKVPARVDDGTLVFVHTADLGLIDFYKLSFRLFGYNVQGFYKTYFLILAASVVLFFAAFWPRAGILLCVNCVVGGIFLAICSLDYGIDTVSSDRFIGTLVLGPVLHLTLLLWMQPPFTGIGAACAALQAALIAFVISMHSASAWAYVPLCTSAVAAAFVNIKPLWRSRPASLVVWRAVTWPMLLTALTLVAVSSYQSLRTHPAYSVLDETYPKALFWYSVASGVSQGLHIDRLFPAIRRLRDDAVPLRLAGKYLEKTIGFPSEGASYYFSSPIFPPLGRVRLYERVLRAAYLDFVKRHPLYMAYLAFVVRPVIIVRSLAGSLAAVVLGYPAYVLSLELTFFAAIGISGLGIRPSTEQKVATVAVAGLALAITVFAMVVYPEAGTLNELFAGSCALGLVLSATVWLPRVRMYLRTSSQPSTP